MKLTYDGIKDSSFWKNADIALPSYNVPAVAEKTKTFPMWAHFGIGNIFRIFIGGIADKLLNAGLKGLNDLTYMVFGPKGFFDFYYDKIAK